MYMLTLTASVQCMPVRQQGQDKINNTTDLHVHKNTALAHLVATVSVMYARARVRSVITSAGLVSNHSSGQRPLARACCAVE
jgi:hypothetical protein